MARLSWVLNISLGYFFTVIELLILVRIVLSWISPGVGSPVSRL
jgi:hypothetical protein